MQDANTVDAIGLGDAPVQKKSAAQKPERQMNNSEKVINSERRSDCRQNPSFEH
jgi:hypothetical protein